MSIPHRTALDGERDPSAARLSKARNRASRWSLSWCLLTLARS